MLTLQTILLALMMGIPTPQAIFRGLMFPAAAPAAMPGFVSETSKNSTLTNALGTKTFNTCSSYAYCFFYPEAALAGNLGIVSFQYSSTPASTPTVTDDKADTYTCLTPSPASNSLLVDVCYAPNLTAGARVLTISFGAAVTNVAAKAAMFDNIATSGPVDASGSAAGASSTTANAVSLNTTQANDLVYMVLWRTGTPSVTSYTQATGYTMKTPDIHDGGVSEWTVDTSTGSITPSLIMSSASTYAEFAVAFKSAAAGTAPSGFYLKALMSWSSPQAQTSNYSFQVPSDAGDLLVSSNSCGGTGPMIPTSVTGGLNTWISTGPVNHSENLVAVKSFYAANTLADSSGLVTVNTTGNGDCTFTFYDYAGAGPFTNLSSYSWPSSSGSSYTITSTQLPWSTAGEEVSMGGHATNTSISILAPAAGCYFDGATYGGEPRDGPEPLDENNPWAHCAFSGTGVQTWTYGLTTTVDNGGGGADIVNFMSPSAIGIINIANNQATSTATLAVTIPTTSAGSLLAIDIGDYNATARTVSKVCLDGTTCAAGNAFTHVVSATASGAASTEVWELLNAPAGATTATITLSGSASNVEAYYWELAKGNGGTWTRDVSNSISSGTVSGGTAIGASVTTTGTQDFCAANVGVASSISANPKSGNEFIYPGTIFTGTSDAATSLLTTTAGAHQPAWSDASGAFSSTTACWK